MLEATGDRFDRGERIIHFVAEHPDEALPRRPLLFAQGPAQVGKDEQFMRQPVFAEVAFPYSPASGGTRKSQGERLVFVGIEAGGETEITGAFSKQLVDRLT